MDLGPALPDHCLIAARRLPAKPDPAIITGRFVRLVPYDVETHLAGVFEALSGAGSFGHPSYDATALVWQYLRSVKCPVSTVDDMEATLKRVRDTADARLFVVQLQPLWTESMAMKGSTSSAAEEGPIIGVVAYLANRPADLAIEIGMVAYTPAFQGTVSSHVIVCSAVSGPLTSIRKRSVLSNKIILVSRPFDALRLNLASPPAAAGEHGGDVPAAAPRLRAGLQACGVEVQLAERAVQGGGPSHRLHVRGHAQEPHDRRRRGRQQPQP